MKLKRDLEEKKASEGVKSPEKTLDLTDIPLMSQSGKAEPEIGHFRAPCSADELQLEDLPPGLLDLRMSARAPMKG